LDGNLCRKNWRSTADHRQKHNPFCDIRPSAEYLYAHDISGKEIFFVLKVECTYHVAQIQEFPDVYDSQRDGNSTDSGASATSDRRSISTPKTIFIVGWIIGNTCSMYALICAFMQLLAYTETRDDNEAIAMYMKHPANSAYRFFLAALVLGCLFMVYPYLWVVGYWEAVLMSGAIVSGAGLIFLHDVTGQISIVVKLKAQQANETQPERSTDDKVYCIHCNAAQ
jgi:hypothetical protein